MDDLFGPILIEALRDIRFGAVAEAILRAKGKWCGRAFVFEETRLAEG